MKRVKAGCIFQTLIFMQKEGCCLTKESQIAFNREEVERYQQDLDRRNIRYQIDSIEEQADASIVVRIRKQLSDKIDVSQYFN